MDPNSLVHAFIDLVSRLSGPVAYCALIGMLLACGLGLPIPEDITLLSAVLIASGERISLTGALITGFVGVLVGDAILFYAGRIFGKRVFSLPGARRLFTPERVASAEARIRKNGPFICFIARFLPGLRSPVFAMSGALGVRPRTFFMLDGLAALVSVPIWVFVGYWFGENFEDALRKVKHVEIYIFTAVGFLIVSYVIFKLVRRSQARRVLVAAAPQLSSVAPGVTDLD